MEELSIEEKAQRYDEVIERAKTEKEKSRNLGLLEFIDENFPELKESMGEKVRKDILDCIRYMKANYCIPSRYTSKQYDTWIAWLENQGKQKSTNKIQFGKEYKCIASPKYSTFVQGKIYKPESEFLCSLMNLCYDCFEPIKNSEQESADKDEPKFKVGDWILIDNPCRITSIDNNKNYYVQYCNLEKEHLLSHVFSRKFCETHFHLWTLQDAKDGDVLHSPSHNLIWVYKDNRHYHACVNMNYVTKNVATNDVILIPNDVCPATNDERTILFEKMKEAGYEWDAKKKELKRIEQPSAWSEEDEYYLNQCITKIEIDIHNWGGHGKTMIDINKEIISWLKSLKDRVGCKVNY